MPVLFTTKTGREFTNPDNAVEFIRKCSDTAFDPGASQVESMVAITELIYTFQALDNYLTAGGTIPRSWANGKMPLRDSGFWQPSQIPPFPPR